jgi:hypothetical protein
METPIGYWTATEASKAWGCHVGTIYHRIHKGTLPAKYIEQDGHYYIRKGEKCPVRPKQKYSEVLYAVSLRIPRSQYREIVKRVKNGDYLNVTHCIQTAIDRELKEENHA